jgi:phosphonopyruvate decarboxylase
MGGASSLGLGLALGAPHRKVMVLDGDGSLLMQLGSLVTVAGAGPANYYHFVFDNGVHQSSGNQPVPGHGKFDWCRLALSAGYRAAHSFDDREELRAALPRIMGSDGPVLIRLGIAREDGPTRWPGVPMSHYVRTLKERLAAEAGPPGPAPG